MAAVLMRIDVVHLAPIGRHIAVRPWADEVLGHSQGAQFVRCKACLVKIDRASGRMEEPDVEFVAQSTFHRSVDELGASHGCTVGKADDDVIAFAARYFREIVETNSNHGAVFGLDETSAVAFEKFPERLEQCFRAWLVGVGNGGIESFLEVGDAALGIGDANSP